MRPQSEGALPSPSQGPGACVVVAKGQAIKSRNRVFIQVVGSNHSSVGIKPAKASKSSIPVSRHWRRASAPVEKLYLGRARRASSRAVRRPGQAERSLSARWKRPAGEVIDLARAARSRLARDTIWPDRGLLPQNAPSRRLPSFGWLSRQSRTLQRILHSRLRHGRRLGMECQLTKRRRIRQVIGPTDWPQGIATRTVWAKNQRMTP